MKYKKYLNFYLISLPFLVLLVNQILEYIYGPYVIGVNPIANIFHFIGGISISLSSAGIINYSYKKKLILAHSKVIIYGLIIGNVCLAIISWEIIEYLFVFPNFPDLLGYEDTIMDMILGLLGGFFGLVLISFLNYHVIDK
tara:strand:+ start:326 stop:748 length:423 start_codon:yes stop_codon:yes gene_type:complete